jgi:hypothetical protein
MDYEAIAKEIIQIVRDQQGYESAAFIPMVAYLKAHFSTQPEAAAARDLAHEMDMIFGMGYATEANLAYATAAIQRHVQACLASVREQSEADYRRAMAASQDEVNALVVRAEAAEAALADALELGAALDRQGQARLVAEAKVAELTRQAEQDATAEHCAHIAVNYVGDRDGHNWTQAELAYLRSAILDALKERKDVNI